VHGLDHHYTLRSTISLAQCLRELEELDTARRLYERVLAVRLTTLGAEHPDTLETMFDIALCRRRWGVLGGGERLKALHLEVFVGQAAACA
jgi:hypothetical protein